MHNAQEIRECIKLQCKKNKVNMGDMIEACDLGVNALRQMTDKKGISVFSLARIADYLDVSMDYLMGRTDKPEVNR